MKIKIKVTKEVLEQSLFCGVYDNQISDHCAIAVAVREIFPHARVSSRFIMVDYRINGTTNKFIDLPEEVGDFIRMFDAMVQQPEKRREIPEFSFEVELHQSIIDTINIDEVYEILANSKTLELV